MSKSKIEWTDKVWNPVTGCTKISPGCQNCYAERMSKRLAGRFGYPAEDPFKVTLHGDRLKEPLSWGKPSKIFVCSMGDLFHKDVPFSYILSVLDMIILCKESGHIFQILTKRPDRVIEFFEWCFWDGFPSNVWYGVTAENQEQADIRIPQCLEISAAVHFVSYEPALGPVVFENHWFNGQCIFGCESMMMTPCVNKPECKDRDNGLDLVIAGGESGPRARPPHPEWFKAVRDQCLVAEVAFMFKQWGEWSPNCLCDTDKPHRSTKRPEPGKQGCMFKCGKKSAGRLLDGVEHMNYPDVKNSKKLGR